MQATHSTQQHSIYCAENDSEVSHTRLVALHKLLVDFGPQTEFAGLALRAVEPIAHIRPMHYVR